MVDDEVEYIGSRVARRAPSVSDSLIHQRPVTGLTLHVEKCGTAAAYPLMFQKTHSSVVQIGRRPGTENDEYNPGKAMFRCPVVSRRHAKIAFADAGSVYLFDLGSHHGTHVRRPDETFSRVLKPESPCLLTGGEFVTLGKSVGKGEDLVRPIVFRVEIHRAQSSPATGLIDLTRSTSTERRHSPPAKVDPSKPSGRYGLNDTSSSSDEMSSSYMNDNSSDIEEILDSPVFGCASLPDTTHSSSHIGQAIEVLKTLIPPIHPPLSPQRSQSASGDQSLSSVFPPIQVPVWDSFPHRPRLPFSPPFELPPLISDKASEVSDWNKLYEDGPDDHVADKSGSNSPMDLASPSPGPPNSGRVFSGVSNVGAWPNSPRAPSILSNSSLYVECGTTAYVDGASDVSVRMPSEEHAVSVVIQEPSNISVDNHDCPASDIARAHDVDLADLKKSLDDIKVNVSNLQSCQDEIKTRIATEVNGLTDKVANFEEQFEDLNCGLNRAEIFSELNATRIQGLQSALSELQNDFKSFVESRKPNAQQEEALGDRQDVKESVETLHQLIAEMETLRDKTQQQMATELDIVKDTRLKLTALMSIQDMKTLSVQNQSPRPESLKRKRDSEGESGAGQNEHDEMVSNKDEHRHCLADKTVGFADSTIGLDDEGVVVPIPKRTRRVASTIFHAATAVALGAVATWSALAYS